MVLVTVIVCGAPLAVRAGDVVRSARREGWNVEVLATPSAMSWFEAKNYGGPNDVVPRSGSLPIGVPRAAVARSAVIVVPMTFNSINKLANGIADTYAHGVLCESLGAGLPLVIVPMVNGSLRGHPAWGKNMGCLRRAGVWIFDPATGKLCSTWVDLSESMDIVDRFEPGRLMTIVKGLLASE